MRNYTCAEYVNTANLRRILRARKVDRDQLAQLNSLEKRLRAQGGDHHRLDFALPDPQVCVDDLFGRLYPKRERGGSTPRRRHAPRIYYKTTYGNAGAAALAEGAARVEKGGLGRPRESMAESVERLTAAAERYIKSGDVAAGRRLYLSRARLVRLHRGRHVRSRCWGVGTCGRRFVLRQRGGATGRRFEEWCGSHTLK